MSRNSTTFSRNTEVRGFTSCAAGATQDWVAGQARQKGNHYSVADLVEESWVLICSGNFTFEIGSERWVSTQPDTEEESENHSLWQRYPKSRTSAVMGDPTGARGALRLARPSFLDQRSGACAGGSVYSIYCLYLLLCLRCLPKRRWLGDVCKQNCSSGSEPVFGLCLGGLLGKMMSGSRLTCKAHGS